MSKGIYETFGKYKLRERLAFGGMAEVFLGTVHGEAGFIKPVVIKRLHPRMSEDEEFIQMLIDEARITAQLTHSNVCQVLDLGSVDGAYYIAMEYISGEDARTIQDHCLRQGLELPIQAALYIVAEVLAGLDYAHRKVGSDGQPLAIIHRDISPQNILVSYEGEVKIIDFGIAKARSRLVQTEAGVIKGKFRYMSPEQASGAKIDHRTDVFAAGVVLYELLRGEPHSLDLSDTEVLRRMRKAEFEPLHTVRPEVSPVLEKVVQRALNLRPGGRYASAEEFRSALLRQLPELGRPFSRTELSSLMQKIFDEERRRKRAASFAGPMDPVKLARPRDPQRSTLDMPYKPDRIDAHAVTHYSPDEEAIDPSDRVSQPHARSHQEPTTNKWVAYAPTALSDSSPRLVDTGALEARPTNELEHETGGPQVQMTAGIIVDDDEETDSRYAPGAKSEDDLSGQKTAPEDDDFSGRKTQLQPDAGTDDTPDDLSGRRTQLQSDSGRMTRERPPTDERRTYPSKPSVRGGHAQRAEPAARQKRGRVAEAGRFTRGDYQPDFHRQPTAPLTKDTVGARSPRELYKQGDLPPAPSGTAKTYRPRAPSPTRRTVIGLVVVVVLAVGLAVGVNYLDKLGLIFGEVAEPDSGAVWPGAGAGDEASDARRSRPRTQPLEKPRLGKIRVRSVPAGARIVLCDKPTDRVTPATVSAPIGEECELELMLEGHETYQMPVEPQRGRTINIVATLRRSQPRSTPSPGTTTQWRKPTSILPPGKGRLRVTSIQVGTVYVNGRETGKTPRLDLPLSPGNYSVKVYFSSVEKFTATHVVTIRVGRTTKVHLEPSL